MESVAALISRPILAQSSDHIETYAVKRIRRTCTCRAHARQGSRLMKTVVARSIKSIAAHEYSCDSEQFVRNRRSVISPREIDRLEWESERRTHRRTLSVAKL